MHRLVACAACGRQYDAGSLAPGRRLRCACGAALTVPRERPRETAVIRCAGCGAPREQDAERCAFCGADFTLHDRDLNTVCPGCLARISSRAAYCPYCGLRIAPQRVAAAPTTLRCPSCANRPRLVSRRFGPDGTPVMECSRCAGMWLDAATLEALCDEAAKQGAAKPAPAQPTRPFRRPPARTAYRPCAVCGRLMPRRQYVRGSGVVVDLCREHGVWFDADELPALLAWIRSGAAGAAGRWDQGPERAAPPAAAGHREERRLESLAQAAARMIEMLFS